jgi:hypothetical protein
LALLAAGLMALSALAFRFGGSERDALHSWLHYLSYPLVQLGGQLFNSASRTRTTEFVFVLYLVVGTGVEGFLVGWCIDRMVRLVGHRR